ncbi:ricin-type beta-trefoil lectin domain protein [Saccharothrix sp. S26]|uniref:RICIN domain-containing protein n=1 Tax=Saccharothrix sp. S26 TaxID=2907215 RepID=UPI001F39C201|nr:RICIN domain-containing protein [Saccharothrix sp. S26]MCE7000294.1 ricin-type beta-trefoil lectin domain protein [Saccharothrix sp. S26]
MKFARVLTAVVALASALLVTPASHADPDAQRDQWKFVSVAVPNDVWDQTNWAWDPEYPIIGHPSHGEDNQEWFINGDSTIESVRYGWCATAIGDKLAGRPCDGSGNQKWKGEPHDGYYSWLMRLEGTDQCVTHNGTYAELVLRTCERVRQDQQWIIGRA